MEDRELPELKIPKKITLLAIILIFVLIISSVIGFTMIIGVGVGHAVIMVDPLTQSTSDATIGPAYALKAPWVTAVDVYYATDTYEDTIGCFSSDQLAMQIQILVRWSLNPGKLKELYTNYPNLNYKQYTIESIMSETIRLVTKNFTTLETIEFRDVVRNQIEIAVKEALNSEASMAGALTGFEFDLKDIGYPSVYTAAIEAKLKAEQEKIQADFERDRILILANATAQEAIITASGEAGAKVIEANATKQAIELVLTSVGQTGNETKIAELYLWVQALQRIAPDIDILIVGNEGTPLLIPSDITTP